MSQCTINSLLNCLEAANHTTLACLAAFKNRDPTFLEKATFSGHKRHHVIKEMSHADHSKKPKIKLEYYLDTAQEI